MELAPKLIEVSVPKDPEGVVLVLHGGASRRREMRVSPAQLSVIRMIPIARRIARAGRGRLAVYRLLNSQRGWATSHTPVHDAHWALDEIAERLGRRVPVCVVGHSLGGRAALLTADRPEVRSVCALAAWVYPDDAPGAVTAERIRFVHGDHDRIASIARAAAVAKRLSGRTEVEFQVVEGGKHAMLKHASKFTRPAADLAVETLVSRQSAPV